MSKKYDLNFTKAVASGNDFIIIDNRDGELDSHDLNYSVLAQDLCRRRLSIGADGLLILEASSGSDFKMRIINPDGSEVDMCGNGARSSALYVSKTSGKESLSIETAAGVIAAVVDGDNIKIKMSTPKDIKLDINLGIDTNVVPAHHINTGVPHVVHLVEDISGYDVKGMGQKIRQHSLFAPEGTNANFVGNIENNSAELRTYERGVEDETLACGTGTVASAIVLGLLGQVKSPVKMKTKSGEVLTVYYKVAGGKVTDVYLEGSANIVCEGRV